VTSETEPEGGDPSDTLRERYASGELTEEQFERTVETLLETEPGPDPGTPERAPDRLTEHDD